jgi:ribonuclease HI
LKVFYEIFADGACEPNPGRGGWGVIIRDEILETELSGGESATTNNRMELMAVIMGLEHVKDPSQITVVSDSQYVIKGASQWMAGWKKKGWRRSVKHPVLNIDLWQRLDAAATPHQVTWKWVRGHNGHPENERADKLAMAAISQQRAGKAIRIAPQRQPPDWAQALQTARDLAARQQDPELALAVYQDVVEFLLDRD